jgi:hypothetical protein
VVRLHSSKHTHTRRWQWRPAATEEAARERRNSRSVGHWVMATSLERACDVGDGGTTMAQWQAPGEVL